MCSGDERGTRVWVCVRTGGGGGGGGLARGQGPVKAIRCGGNADLLLMMMMMMMLG